MGSRYARTGGRGGRVWRGAVWAVVVVLCGVTGCGASGEGASGDGAGERDQPREESTSEWVPWQTTFHGVKEKGSGPSANFERVCLRGVVPDSAEAEANELGGRMPGGEGREGLLDCRVTGSRGELLEFADGRHRSSELTPERTWDSGRTDGVVINSERPTADLGNPDLDRYVGKARALKERNREVIWQRKVRSASVYDSGLVIGDELTKITNKPKDGDFEDWSADFQPGGALIAWDAKGGRQKWRIKPPTAKDLCSPQRAGDQVLVTCDQGIASERVWYRLDQEKRKLVRLHKEPLAQRDTALIGADGDFLLFLPSRNMFEDKREFTDLVRVDSRNGERQRRKLPGSIPQGARPSLVHGTIYFQDPLGGDVIAVDPTTGEKRWQRELPMDDPSAPTVSTKRDEVYFVDPAGRLTALDRKTGEERWRTRKARAEDGGTKPNGLRALSTATLVEDDILVVAAGNTVFSVTPEDPEAKPEVIHRVDLGED